MHSQILTHGIPLFAVALLLLVSQARTATVDPNPSSGSGYSDDDDGYYALKETLLGSGDETSKSQGYNGYSGDDDDGSSGSHRDTATTATTVVPTTSPTIVIGVQSERRLADLSISQQTDLKETVATFVVSTTSVLHADIDEITLAESDLARRYARDANTLIVATVILKPTFPVDVAEKAADDFEHAIQNGFVDFFSESGFSFSGFVGTSSVHVAISFLTTQTPTTATTTPSSWFTASTMSTLPNLAEQIPRHPSSRKFRRVAVICGCILVLIPMGILFAAQPKRREDVVLTKTHVPLPKKRAALAPSVRLSRKKEPRALPAAGRRSSLLAPHPRRIITLGSSPPVKVSTV